MYVPQLAQPGEASLYAYDYDVMGMVLGRAYGMTPEALMKEKLWTPLGMDSALMFQAQADDSRLDDVIDIHFKGPANISGDYNAPGSIPSDAWIWAVWCSGFHHGFCRVRISPIVLWVGMVLAFAPWILSC
jgi:CubicO group peptidase (beta-lactamase class C family)